jgi:hypothetical protein
MRSGSRAPPLLCTGTSTRLSATSTCASRRKQQSRQSLTLRSLSYDLYMFSPEPGEEPVDTLERLEEREEAAGPDAAIAERNRRIADALIGMNSNYTESEIKFDVIAEQAGISLEEARAKHRYIQLMDESGLQVTLSDDQASINIPYWDSLDPKHLGDEIAKASKLIGRQRAGGCTTRSWTSSLTRCAMRTSSQKRSRRRQPRRAHNGGAVVGRYCR